MSQLTATTQDVEIAEKPARLSESHIWERQKNFYVSMGIEAWRSGTIPTRITTNSYIARDYARLIASYVVDSQAEELTIIELGAGHGRLGFLCVQHLKELQEAGLLPDVRWQYVLTDVALRNIEFWEQHEGIRKYIDEGLIDVAEYAAGTEELKLRHSGRTISTAARSSNIVVIGNYVFDSLPIDLYQIEDHKLYECLPVITKNPEWVPADETSSEDSSVSKVDEFKWRWQREEAEEQLYSDAGLQHLVDYFRDEFDNTCFEVPVSGCATISMIDSWSDNGLLLLMADKGYLRDIDFEDRKLPHPVPHGGCYSFSANFVAFAEWFEHIGGNAFLPEFRDSAIQVAAYMTRSGDPGRTHLERQFLLGNTDFSPGDYYQVVRSSDRDSEHLDLRYYLSVVRLSACEPLVFYSLRRHIRDAVSKAKERDQQAVREVLQTVAKRNFLWGEKDIPFAIAHIHQNMGDYAEAVQYYRESLRLHGEHSVTFSKLSECMLKTGDTDEAMELANRALELNPESRGAKAVLASLDESTE